MSHQCTICGKKYEYKHTLARHMKVKHKSVLHVDPANVKPLNAWVKDATALISYTCLKCGQMFPSQQFLDDHIKEKGHKQEYPVECFVCKKLFPTQDELKVHVDQEHSPPCHAAQQLPGTVSEDIVCKQLKFAHPFSMIVAGPSRSGKTHWVIDLLVNMETRIIPTPTSITYCFAHWQDKYEYLEQKIPSVQFYEGLPSTTYFNSLSNAIVVFDDLMDASMGNQDMMNMFTERSHHQNISVILMMQNIFHQGSKSRTIQLNTQYMVLFKNARDRQQIKTLAMQMYPQKWKNFLEHFEHETSKPYGKVIIDLRPNTREEHRLISDNNANNLIVKQYEQQQRTLQYSNPNLAQAQKVQENISSLLENPMLNDEQKASRYSNLMRDYQMYMSNAETPPHVPTIPPWAVLSNQSLQTPFTGTPLIRQLPPQSTPFGTPLIRQLTPQIPPPFFTGTFPTPPDSNMRLAAQTPLPPASSDEDDPLSTFVSLSDDEATRGRKEREADRKYALRRYRKKKDYPRK